MIDQKIGSIEATFQSKSNIVVLPWFSCFFLSRRFPGHYNNRIRPVHIFRPCLVSGPTSYAPGFLSLLLCGRGFRLGGLLPIALDHDHAEERAHDSGAQQDQDDGDSDSPDARRKEVLERVVRVDKGLRACLLAAGRTTVMQRSDCGERKGWSAWSHTMNRVQKV